MWRSVRIEGSATPIIDTSSASRKSAPQSTSSAPQARLLSCSDCGVGSDTNDSFGRLLLFDRYRTVLFDGRQTMIAVAPDLATVEGVTVLQALSDPVRLEIVRQLAGCDSSGEMKCGDI